MRAAGVHQGLAPVLDVTRDYRWGRTEETIGEDPYLVGTVGSAYVRGLERRRRRRHAEALRRLLRLPRRAQPRAGADGPPRAGRRHPAAVRDGAAPRRRPVGDELLRRDRRRAGRPPTRAADRAAARRVGLHRHRGRRLLRGAVPADAARRRRRRRRRRPGSPCGPASTSNCPPWTPSARRWSTRCARGEVDEALVDRALRRVLTQKVELGLLDEGWRTLPDDVDAPAPRRRGRPATSPCGWPGSRSCCCATTGVLPLAAAAAGSPWSARSPTTRWRCSAATRSRRTSACNHPDVRTRAGHPDAARRARPDRVPDLRLRAGVHGRPATTRSGIAGGGRRGRAPATCACSPSATGPGLFGRGTSGEGCDAADLRLPGVQADLVRAVLATGTPVVLVLLTGRPYALGPEFDAGGRRGAGVLPRPAGRAGARRGAHRRGRTRPGGCRSACPRDAGGLPTHLPRAAAGPAHRGVLGRPDAGVPVRPRAELHDVRVDRRDAWSSRRRCRAGRLAGRRRGDASRITVAQHR